MVKLIWPFKVRDLPETKNRLIPERVYGPVPQSPEDLEKHRQLFRKVVTQNLKFFETAYGRGPKS